MGKQEALVPFGERIKLSDYDAGYTGEYEKKGQVKELVKANLACMAELQELMFVTLYQCQDPHRKARIL